MWKAEYVFTENEIEKIKKSYVSEIKSIQEIADENNVGYSVIKRVLNNNGIITVKGSPFSIKYWLERGLNEEQANKKIKTTKPVYIEYWLNKGFTEEESKLKVDSQAMKTERAYIEKYGESGAEIYKNKKLTLGHKSPRSKKSWIEKGYSEEEAIKKVSEVQSVYSRKILYEKYGEEVGERMMKERNEKWQKKLKENPNFKEIQKSKSASGISDFKNRYGDDYIEQYLNKRVNKLFIKETRDKLIDVLNENNYNKFLNIIGENHKYDSKFIYRISKVSIFSYVFNKQPKEIKEDLVKQYTVRNKNGYGTTYSIDGKIVRSLSELKIYEHLLNIGSNFEYDYLYPNQKTFYKCDFYLKDFDLYIEYAGMTNIKKRSENKKVLDDYDTRLKVKTCV